MAASILVERGFGRDITLFEANSSLGRKLLLTGGGRCNLTTALTDEKEILSKYPRGAKFLKFAIKDFPPAKVREWFLDRGLPTVVERGD